jgi:hypothetical protein
MTGVAVAIRDAAGDIGCVDQRGWVGLSANARRGINERLAIRGGVLGARAVGFGNSGHFAEAVIFERGRLLASDGTFNYQHDADGNRTIRTRISNAQASDYQTKDFYDYRNRLTDEEYFNNSGTLTKHVHYVYDTLDHQIGEQIDDTGGGTYDRTERFALDGGQPIALFDANGNMIDRNLVAPTSTGVDAVMAQEGIATPGQAGSTNWTLPDNLGTPHDEVNSSGAVADHIVTDSFGQVSSQSNAAAQPWTGFGGGHPECEIHEHECGFNFEAALNF